MSIVLVIRVQSADTRQISKGFNKDALSEMYRISRIDRADVTYIFIKDCMKSEAVMLFEKEKGVLKQSIQKLMHMKYTKYIGIYVVFMLMFFVGRHAAKFAQEYTAAMAIASQAENWGLGFGGVAEGGQPTGNETAEGLKKYDAYFVGDADEKVIYLTFDCGYENGNTEAILDALKKHNVSATFFVVGHFVESAPELLKRMVAEGHTVGNHTYHHPDMSEISELSAFQKEVEAVAEAFKAVTGTEMEMYYRPPQGKYSVKNLEMAQQLGYATFFWSLAHVDWNVDKQPSPEEALQKLTSRIHPGAIVLLHNTSSTNGKIMDELLSRWESMGYTFGTLEELQNAASN